MPYLYETHCHGSQCSACGKSTTQDIVRAYHAAGYAGLILTDHFIRGNTAVDRSLPWDTKMRLFYDAYLDAKTVGDELDFDVIFGIEEGFGGGKEVLLYNIDLNFLLANPDMCEVSLDELVKRVHTYGGLVVQAHPYRNQSYINMDIPPRDDIVDGIEVYNANNGSPEENIQAFSLAQKRGLIMTSGGDVHKTVGDKLGMAGMAFPYRIRSGQEFVDALKRGDGRCVINGRVADPLDEECLKELE